MAWKLKQGDCVLVLGCGVSGVAGARLCHKAGARVWVADEAGEEGRVAETAAALRAMGVAFGDTLPRDVAFGLCVVSPGFGKTHAWVRECGARGIPIISELELGARFWEGKILAVTGSKGKSSLVKVCCEGLNAGGMRAVTAGNYGTPLSARALELGTGNGMWAVTEVSSFQLEFVEDFRPDVAVLLNLQADHLDRHADEAEYRACKLRMFARMGAGCAALLPEDLEGFAEVAGALEERGATCVAFGTGENAAWRHGRTGTVGAVGISGSWFDNPVLGLAAAAGVGALHACGVEKTAVEQAFREYSPLPHRMELVAEAGGVRWVDDSKATSFAAVVAALDMTTGPARLIAGGRIKEHDVDFVKKKIATRARKVYLIGECAEFLSQAWAGAAACETCGDMATAVRRASDDASPGETVLLSPGCASFDQFAGYHERGDVFARLAREAAARRM